jgi:hypothetical protein
MLPGNLALDGWLVVIEDGRDPWRGMVNVFIPQGYKELPFKLPFCKLTAGKLYSVGQQNQKLTPSAKTGVLAGC